MLYPVSATFGFSRQTFIAVDLDSFPGRKDNFSSLQRAQTNSGVYTASFSKGTEVLFHVENSQGMNFTTYLHLELRFRITKALTILSIYVFMVQTE
jgi:hypothetical protein